MHPHLSDFARSINLHVHCTGFNFEFHKINTANTILFYHTKCSMGYEVWGGMGYEVWGGMGYELWGGMG